MNAPKHTKASFLATERVATAQDVADAQGVDVDDINTDPGVTHRLYDEGFHVEGLADGTFYIIEANLEHFRPTLDEARECIVEVYGRITGEISDADTDDAVLAESIADGTLSENVGGGADWISRAYRYLAHGGVHGAGTFIVAGEETDDGWVVVQRLLTLDEDDYVDSIIDEVPTVREAIAAAESAA